MSAFESYESWKLALNEGKRSIAPPSEVIARRLSLSELHQNVWLGLHHLKEETNETNELDDELSEPLPIRISSPPKIKRSVSTGEDYFSTYVEKSIERAKSAPPASLCRYPSGGYLPREKDIPQGVFVKIAMPQDVYGTRKEGARFHTHYLPLYKPDTPRSVVLNDWINDCSINEINNYIHVCYEERLSPKSNEKLYKYSMNQMMTGFVEIFIEKNEYDRTWRWGDDAKLFEKLKFLVANPDSPDSVKDDMFDSYSFFKENEPESIWEPETRDMLATEMINFLVKEYHKTMVIN